MGTALRQVRGGAVSDVKSHPLVVILIDCRRVGAVGRSAGGLIQSRREGLVVCDGEGKGHV